MPYTIIKPTYFDDFHCLGSDCKLTCCRDWNIDIWKSEYSSIKNVKKSKELAQAVAEGLKRNKTKPTDYKYAYIKFNEQGLCTMLNKEGLCQLQVECGYKTIPIICKAFPRQRYLIATDLEHPMVEEICTLACEQVTKMLMKLENGIEFTSETLPHFTEKYNGKIYKQSIKQRPATRYLLDIQTLSIAILQNRSFSLHQRMLLLGIALQHISNLELNEKIDEIPAYVDTWLNQPIDSSSIKFFNNLEPNYGLQISNAIANLKLKNLHTPFIELRDRTFQNLNVERTETGCTYNISKYNDAVETRKKYFQNREYILENIIVNYFFYLLQPFTELNITIWQNYMSFCSLYSLLHFFLAGALANSPDDETFINAITVFSRTFTHSDIYKSVFCKRLDEFDSNTLAHMAVLINC